MGSHNVQGIKVSYSVTPFMKTGRSYRAMDEEVEVLPGPTGNLIASAGDLRTGFRNNLLMGAAARRQQPA